MAVTVMMMMINPLLLLSQFFKPHRLSGDDVTGQTDPTFCRPRQQVHYFFWLNLTDVRAVAERAAVAKQSAKRFFFVCFFFHVSQRSLICYSRRAGRFVRRRWALRVKTPQGDRRPLNRRASSFLSASRWIKDLLCTFRFFYICVFW